LGHFTRYPSVPAAYFAVPFGDKNSSVKEGKEYTLTCSIIVFSYFVCHSQMAQTLKKEYPRFVVKIAVKVKKGI
jgi:hypothetical protein